MADSKSKIVLRGIIISIVAMLVLTGVVMGATQTLSNSGGEAWEYKKEINIQENSGSTLTDYQVLVQLSGTNFPMNTRVDGADIRFEDTNGNELSYWIESWDYSGNNAKIWVKVPSLSANTAATISMYYGNPSASKSDNGDSTFEFFDDFDGNNIDTSKWEMTTIGSASYNVNDGILHAESGMTPRSFFRIKSSSYYVNLNEQNIAIESRFKAVINEVKGEEHYFGMVNRIVDYLDDNAFYLRREWTDAAYTRKLHTQVEETVSKTSYWSSDGNWHNYKITATPNKLEVYEDDSSKGVLTSNIPNSVNLYPFIKAIMNGELTTANNIGDWDWIIVRKFTSSEPTINVGNEQPVSTPILSVTKTTSPQSIKQGQTSTVTISVENTGTTDISDIEIADTMPSDVSFVSGEISKKYTTLRPKDVREFQYVVRINDVGTFNLDPAQATYADDEGNYYSTESNAPSIKTIASLDSSSNQETSNYESVKDNDEPIDVQVSGEIPGFGAILSIFGIVLVFVFRRKIN